MAFRINHLHLKTPDPKKTADFYVEYTGAKIAKESTRSGWRQELSARSAWRGA